MALRAGYYGVKRFLRDKLETIAKTYDETIKSLFPRSEQAVLGTKNLLPYPYTDKGNKTDNGITFIDNGDGTITAQAGTASANAQYFIAGSSAEIIRSVEDIRGNLFSKGFISEGATLIIWYYDNNKSYISAQGANKDGILFNIPSNAVYYSMLIRINSGITLTNDVTFKPMIRLASDPDSTYVPYAMTNKELTDSVAELTISVSDQKTAINAIITAATEAADFAAFKASMGAITLVTRSVSLTKEDITEEVKEVEPEKTVTKKRTTKKTEEV